MKTKIASIVSLIFLLALTSCSQTNHTIKGEYFTYQDIEYTKTIGSKVNNEKYDYNIKTEKLDNQLRNDFAYGVDISTIEMVLENGGTFYNQEGKQQDVFEILKENGVNFIRVKLWDNPYDETGHSYGGGHNDKHTDLRILKKAKRVGMNLMLDFHYSDFWADPKTQCLPKAWRNTKDILQTVYDYTFSTLNFYKKEGLNIDAIQLGNEINNGLIYLYGKLDFINYDQSIKNIAQILKSANKAAKTVYSETKTIIHLANPQDRSSFIRYLKAMELHQLDYDIIGVTCYPYYQQINDQLFKNLNYASTTFNKPIMIVETSYGYTFKTNQYSHNIFNQDKANKSGFEVSIQGQVDVLNTQLNMLSRIENNMGLGLFYWEPCWLPIKGAISGSIFGQAYQFPNADINKMNDWKNGHANQALFDFNGRMLPSLLTYKKIQHL